MDSAEDEVGANSFGKGEFAFSRAVQNCTFAQVLSRLRAEQGMTQTLLASSSRISLTYLSKIEEGIRPAPPRNTGLRIARALGLDRNEAVVLANLALKERGTAGQEAEFPHEVQQLLEEIRSNASVLPLHFTHFLTMEIREETLELANHVLPERGITDNDSEFVQEVRQLLDEIRRHAYSFPPSFVRCLRMQIREGIEKPRCRPTVINGC